MALGKNKIFLDVSYAIALASMTDEHHGKAIERAGAYDDHPFVTTRVVLLEIGNALSGLRHRQTAASYLKAVEEESTTEVVPLSTALFYRGLELFEDRADKTWSLVDCISFVVMEEQGLKDALTTDRHFEQAGFNALLRG